MAITHVETQEIRPQSELLKELQAIPVTKAVIYRNVDKKAWEQIAKAYSANATLILVQR